MFPLDENKNNNKNYNKAKTKQNKKKLKKNQNQKQNKTKQKSRFRRERLKNVSYKRHYSGDISIQLASTSSRIIWTNMFKIEARVHIH